MRDESSLQHSHEWCSSQVPVMHAPLRMCRLDFYHSHLRLQPHRPPPHSFRSLATCKTVRLLSVVLGAFAIAGRSCAVTSARDGLAKSDRPEWAPLPRPAGRCHPLCPTYMLGNVQCNPSCNTVDCGFDGGDCLPDDHNQSTKSRKRKSGECSSGCPRSWQGDGICDTVCDTAACGYDSGDCIVANTAACSTRARGRRTNRRQKGKGHFRQQFVKALLWKQA